MATVREGSLNDLQAIVGMAAEFWCHTIYDEPVCDKSVEGMAMLCIDQGLMSVLTSDDEVVGFACGVKGPLLGNNEVSTGTEIAWWVDPEHRHGRNGIALLKHIEGLAKLAGIKYWNMAYMESSMPEQVKAIYEKMGYRKTEVIYSRVL
jgi:GNAT superfamily N-acetyltransferase